MCADTGSWADALEGLRLTAGTITYRVRFWRSLVQFQHAGLSGRRPSPASSSSGSLSIQAAGSSIDDRAVHLSQVFLYTWPFSITNRTFSRTFALVSGSPSTAGAVAQQFGGVESGGAVGFDRLHAVLNHVSELA